MTASSRAAARGSLLVALVAVVASCSSGSHANSAVRPTTVGPDPADVAAARACHLFDVYLNDAKNRRYNRNDSDAFDRARKKLDSSPGPDGRWSQLADDLTTFVNDASANDLGATRTDGRQAGLECAKIPQAARVAGGFT
jgi:hypothetical protein